VLAGVAASAPASAQLSGDLYRGQYGLASGTQAPEGLITTLWVYDYYSTQIVGPDGSPLNTTGSLNALAVPGLNLWFVSPWKILGANYGAVISLYGTTPQVDLPRLNTSQSTYGFGDMYVKPLELGWHTTFVDVITGLAIWLPTGSYTPGGTNTGQGQWGFEISAGATVWFDEGHHFNFSSQGFYDIYAPKSQSVTIAGTEYQIRTGNILSFQGGLGYQFLDGALNIGIPYSLQFKITQDELPNGPLNIPAGITAAKSWSIGLGAEVDFFFTATDGITARFLQTFAGNNVSNGSSYFLFYTHVFALFGAH
jgi:hypothetical protein